MDKFLICGLGNPGDEYANTRHNTGWMAMDNFAKAMGAEWRDRRYGFVAETSLKGRSRLLVISDDVALPLGEFRLKGSGSNGGHNGLGHIIQLIGENFSRLRIGIGNDYPRGGQVDWVLGHYSADDMKILQPTLDLSVDIIKSFVLQGINETMNQFNKLGKRKVKSEK